MNQEQITKIKEKIIADISAVEAEILSLVEKTKPITPDCSLGRLTRQEMIQEQQVYEHALRVDEIRLNKLNYALGKVEKDGYGVCAECEDDILFERLMLVPESSHCVSCKEELGL